MSASSSNEELAWHWTKSLPSVAAYIRSMVPDFHDSQDILQEVSVAVVRSYHEYDRQRPFIGWALGIARNKILAYHRQTTTERRVFSDATIDQISKAFVETAVEVSPLLEALQQCLKRVAGRSRQLLELRYLEGLRYEQIAENVDMTVASLKMAMLRLRAALRACIERRLDPGSVE